MKKLKFDFSIETQDCEIDVKSFCDIFEGICRKYKNLKELSHFIEQIRDKKTPSFVCHSSKDFSLTTSMENYFFKCLLGELKKGDSLTKYTTTDNLFRICNDNEIAMVSIVGMNDSKECFYAYDYLKSKGIVPFLTKSDDYFLGSYAYITSFTKHSDNLTMWRLYGDDANGIALTFYLDDELKDGFILAPVSYGEEDGTHKKMDFIAEMQKVKIEGRQFVLNNLYFWRYFFKPVQYKIEEEIRLLYFPEKIEIKKWVKTGVGIISPISIFSILDNSSSKDKSKKPFPLKLKSITLGPQMTETKTNKEMGQLMLRNCFGCKQEDIEVKESEINNFRKSL